MEFTLFFMLFILGVTSTIKLIKVLTKSMELEHIELVTPFVFCIGMIQFNSFVAAGVAAFYLILIITETLKN